MIRHFVMLRFRADVSDDTKLALFEALDGLRGHIAGVLDFRAVANVSVETDLIRGNHDAFWFDFTDTAARDAYLIDPEHQAVGRRLVEHTVDGIEGVTVFDMELPD